MALVGNISGSAADNWNIKLTGSVIIADPGTVLDGSPGAPSTYPVIGSNGVGNNVTFFVSGSRKGASMTGPASSATALFGGDVWMSGALVIGAGHEGGESFMLGGVPEEMGADTYFHVSGTVLGQGIPPAEDGNTGITAIFGGDTVISGVLKVGEGIPSGHGGSISGSIQQTSDGLSYLVGGNNITITSGTNGQVTITSAGGGVTDAQYVVLAATSDLSDERVLTAGTGIDLADGGANSTATLSVDNDVVATVSGTAFTGPVTVNELGGDNDFRVETQGEDEALFVDASENKLHINKGETAFETHVASTNDVAVSVTAAGVVLNEDGHATNDFRVESTTHDHMFFVDSSTNRISIGTAGASPATTVHIKETAPTLRIQRSSNANDSTIDFAGQAGAVGAVMHLSNSNDLVFKTHDGANPDEMFRIGSYSSVLNRQIIFLSGSGMESGAMQPKEATDIAFFVSGAIGSKGTAVKGAAVFGGDAVVSGALHLEEITDPGTIADGTVALYAKDDSGATKIFYKHGSTVVGPLGTGGGGGGISFDGSTANGVLTFKDSDEATVESNLTFDGSALTLTGDASLNGAITINEAGADKDFRVESNTREYAVFVDASTDQVLLGSIGSITPGADVGLFVSGAVGSVSQASGHAAKGATVIGGDLVVSGGVYFGPLSTPIVGVSSFTSGTILHQGDGNATEATAVFGGDTVVSGVLKVGEGVEAAGHGGGISGSIQQTAAGLSYIVAGSFMSVTSGTNGQVTIALGGTPLSKTGTPADNQIAIWTDSDTLEGTSTLTYDGTTIGLNDAVTINEAGGDNDFRVESVGEDEALFIDADANTLYINKGETDFTTIIGSDNDEAIRVGSAGVVFNEDGHDTNDFRIETDDIDNAVFVDASTNQILFGASSTPSDTFHFVSGNINGIIHGGKVSAFGGDTIVSGVLGGGSNGLHIGGGAYGEPVSIGAAYNYSNARADIGNDATIILSGNVNGAFSEGGYYGVTAINADVMLSGNLVGTYGDHFSELRMIGSPIVTSPYWGAGQQPGSDVAVFFSGSAGSMNYNDSAGVVVVGGDMFVTGGLTIGTVPQAAANPTPNMDFSVNTSNYAGRLFVDGSEDHVVVGRYGDQGISTSIGEDTLFHVSGTIDPMDGSGAGSDSVTVLAGDVILSGALVGTRDGNALGLGTNSQVLGLKAGSNGFGTIQAFAGDVRFESFSQIGGPTGGDIYLSVSGTIDPLDGSNAGSDQVSAFGGDVILSGALVGTRIGNDGDQALGLKAGSSGHGTIQGFGGHVRFESFSETGGPQGSDIYLSVSGNLGSAKQPQTYGSAVFGGDMVVSGGIYTEMGIETTKDFSAGTQLQLPMAGMSTGENLVFSPGANDTLTAGKIYFLHTDGTWNETDANDVADGAGSMLGVGRGGGSQTMGVLKRGYVRIPPSLYNGTFATGSAVYVSDDATGEWDFTAPAGSGDFVRVVGYGVEALHGGTSDIVVYFNPSNDYVEIA